MPGLPGTGVGGVFYGLLIVWITLREFWRTVTGRGQRKRWAKLARFCGILLAIIATFWLVGQIISVISRWLLPSDNSNFVSDEAAQAVAALIPAFAVFPVLIMFALVVGLHAARWLIRSKPRAAASIIRPAAVRADRRP